MAQMSYSNRLARSEHLRAQKRRRKAITFSLALAGILAVGGTIAWLFDVPSKITNSFDPVEVTCMVDETFDSEVKSDVSVKNTGDVDAYIRADVVVTWTDGSGNVLAQEPIEGTDYDITYASDTDWVLCTDGYFYHSPSVKPDDFTDVLISRCEPLQNAPEEGYFLSVDILCSAIQADGTSDGTPAVVDAWGTDANHLEVVDGMLVVANA